MRVGPVSTKGVYVVTMESCKTWKKETTEGIYKRSERGRVTRPKTVLRRGIPKEVKILDLIEEERVTGGRKKCRETSRLYDTELPEQDRNSRQKKRPSTRGTLVPKQGRGLVVVVNQ